MISQLRNSLALFFCALFFVGGCTSNRKVDPPPSDSARIKITSGDQVKTFSRELLLSSPHVRTLVVKQDPAYDGRPMTYQAVPISEVFKEFTLKADSTLLFTCLDGFSAPIDATKVLNQDPKGSIAYLAVETVESPWPNLKPGNPASAGPFYLVWENPEKSKVSREEWPFQLSGFQVKPPLAEQFPLIYPPGHLPKDSVVGRGFKVFAQNCFTCHTMNGQGASQMGPDLNLPFSPIEYFQPGYLAKQIRDPQSVKRWPQGKMPAFDKASLSDADLKAVIEYLRHMSKHRPRSK